MRKLDDPRVDLTPLLDVVLELLSGLHHLKARARLSAIQLEYDNFLGASAVGRVYEGVIYAKPARYY